MLDTIKKFVKFSSESGLRLPSAYDSDKKGASVTLLFAHIANSVAIVSLCMLTYQHTALGVLASTGYSVAMIGFYLIRRLGKFSVDLKDGKIEAEDDNQNEKEQ